MTDQEAREKTAQDTIADRMLEDHIEFCGEDNCCKDAESYLPDAQRILDALAADGWAAVRAKWEYQFIGPDGHLHRTRSADSIPEGAFRVQRHLVSRGPWEPVTEGSDQ